MINFQKQVQQQTKSFDKIAEKLHLLLTIRKDEEERIMNNDVIIFSDADDAAYCDSCDALLYERKDQSFVCSNPECGKIFAPDSVTKHRMELSPDKLQPQERGPEVVPITGFTDTKKKKKSTVFDREDQKLFSRAGVSLISVEDFLPE
jgi:hypothetical protein